MLSAAVQAAMAGAGYRSQVVLIHPKVPDVPMYLGGDGVRVTPVENVLEVAFRLAGTPELERELREAFGRVREREPR